MKYFKSLGLCLVAVFALGAVVASSAFASEGPTLLFPNGGGAKPNFSSVSGKGKLVSKAAGKALTIECKAAKNTGVAIPGTDRVEKVVIAFTGCTGKIKEETVKCGQPPLAPMKPLLRTRFPVSSAILMWERP